MISRARSTEDSIGIIIIIINLFNRDKGHITFTECDSLLFVLTIVHARIGVTLSSLSFSVFGFRFYIKGHLIHGKNMLSSSKIPNVISIR